MADLRGKPAVRKSPCGGCAKELEAATRRLEQQAATISDLQQDTLTLAAELDRVLGDGSSQKLIQGTVEVSDDAAVQPPVSARSPNVVPELPGQHMRPVSIALESVRLGERPRERPADNPGGPGVPAGAVFRPRPRAPHRR